MKLELVPSLIASSQAELDSRYARIHKLASTVQLDVMDGLFVPHTSLQFPFALKAKDYEAHLMVQDPFAWIHEHNADSFIIHYESKVHLHELIKLIRKKKSSVGLAINPKTPVESVSQYLDHIDMVLVMTVQPGAYGGRFLKQTLNKVAFLREKSPGLAIEVDGGITPETLPICKKAGANRFVVGSYLQKAKSVSEAWKKLQNMIK